MATRKAKKKHHGMTLNTAGIPILRMDRETTSSLSKKLRSTDAEIEKLKTRLSQVEQRLEVLEQ